MKKRLLAILLASALCLGLAACGGGTASTPAPAASQAAAPAASQAAAPAASQAAAPAASQAAEPAAPADVKWPTENIQLYVPGKAGGPTDTAARIVADYLEKATGGTVVVMNEETGAGAVLCETIRTTDKPNYNIAILGSQNVTLLLNDQYQYDVRDASQFTIIDRLITGAHNNIFAAGKDAPFHTYDEFVEYAKANPGKVRVCVQTGALSYIFAKLICDNAGVEVKFLEATSASEQVTNVVGGLADCFVAAYNTMIGYDGTGELYAMVSIGLNREENYPDALSMTDLGLADKFATGGQFIVGSANIDPAVVAKLNEIFANFADDADSAERAATTNNVIDVLGHEGAVEIYNTMYDMYAYAAQ